MRPTNHWEFIKIADGRYHLKHKSTERFMKANDDGTIVTSTEPVSSWKLIPSD